MKTTTMQEYNLEQCELLKGHTILSIVTSPFEDNRYTKHYMCEDGFELWEVNRIIFESREVKLNVYGLEIFKEIKVKLYEHEMWSTKSQSVFAYECIE